MLGWLEVWLVWLAAVGFSPLRWLGWLFYMVFASVRAGWWNAEIYFTRRIDK
jgi:hypothetical protein